jgi:dihydroorotate dehydrogenase (fumarate)
MSTQVAHTLRMDLRTTYLGLSLAHPLVCGASPLTSDMDLVLQLEDAGAAAIVMHSLFEEQLIEGLTRRAAGAGARAPRMGQTGAPQSPYALPPDRYLEHLIRVKQRVGVPVIASLNGTTPEGWLQYGRALARAGADALEMNFYNIATDAIETSEAIEQRLIDIVAVVTDSVPIPVAVKLSPFYTSLPNLALRLERIGADGLVLFNRFYQADIDPETGGRTVTVQLSDSLDLLLRLHAIAMLSGRRHLSLALTGGVHEPVDVVKGVMAGADVVQLTSTLLRHGPSRLTYLRTEFEKWCEAHGHDSLARLKGCAAAGPRAAHARLGRDDYRAVLQSWTRDHLPMVD